MNAESNAAALSPPILKIGAVVVRAAPVGKGDESSSHSPLEGESMRYLNAAVGGIKQQYNPPTDARKAHPAPPREGSTTDALSVVTHHPPRTTYEILIIRPIPKQAGEVPPFVLPRGSRQYQDASGMWHDARDVATGFAHAATLEPFTRALAREIE
ncbi:MAG: hypothetical protein K2X09_04145, partial [Rickettsiales bacterium]|nr:hypothetical protein [Rickettsiales bacterium]